MERLTGQDIICLAHLPWDGPWKTYHQIISRVAESNRVLCIDPPSTLRQVQGVVQGRASIPPVLRRMSERLFVYHPPWWLSRPRTPSVEGVIAPLRLRHALWTSRRLGFRSPILWTFEPTLGPSTDLFAPRFLVYHVVDNYVEYLPSAATAARVRMAGNHDRLLGRADVVLAVTPGLRDACRRVNPSTYLVPNAVDVERFQRAVADPYVPDDLRGIRKPIVGYVGGIEPKFDLETIRWLAEARPQWSVVIVGPAMYASIREALRTLAARYPNVHYLNGKRPEEVPHYVKALDVALLVDREKTDGDSLKLYEYLACGRPVVAFEASVYDSTRHMSHLLSLAKDREDFLVRVQQGLDEPAGPAEARIAFAREQTWQRRVEQMSGLIAARLPDGPSARRARHLDEAAGPQTR